MIAFIVFLVFVFSITIALFVGPLLKERSEDYPVVNPETETVADKPEPIFIVSKTFAEAEKWRKDRNKSRIGVYWVSGPGGLSTVRNAMVVFTGQWQARPDAPDLWAQAHAGTDISIFIDGEPEPVVQENSVDEVYDMIEDRTP